LSAGFLLDTSVISAVAPGRPPPPSWFGDWIDANEYRFYLSVLTLFEIEQGAARLERAGGTRRAALYRAWIAEVADRFGERVLPLDAPAAERAGRISARALAEGKHPGVVDVFIAAIAAENDLTLLTRNLRHFAPLGVEARDPLLTPPG
jgi:predicted nucleic acid-binding protein